MGGTTYSKPPMTEEEEKLFYQGQVLFNTAYLSGRPFPKAKANLTPEEQKAFDFYVKAWNEATEWKSSEDEKSSKDETTKKKTKEKTLRIW
jgi:hypothetical protein